MLAGNLLQVFGQFPVAVIDRPAGLDSDSHNVVNNAAAAVLIAPIACDSALVIGASPDLF